MGLSKFLNIQNKYLDETDLLTKLENNIEKTNMFNNSIIYIDEFLGFTKQELSIIGKLLNNIKPKCDINFLFSNYEEVGHGASSFVPKNTIEFIAVDMGCPGENQNSSEYDVCICTKDSNGPYDYELINKLVDTCKKNNINYKLDISPNYGSDATTALKSGMDVKFALIGPGIFASHGYERTHINSIIETKKLIINYIK